MLFGTFAATLYLESTSSVMSYFKVDAKRMATSLSLRLYFFLIHVANWEVATWIDSGTEPLTPKAIFKLLEAEPREEVEAALAELKRDYERPGGLQLVEVAGGYQIVTRPDLHEWVRRLFQERTTQKLSVQALETLAVVAYRQPITALEITEVRGVNTSGVLNTLLEAIILVILVIYIFLQDWRSTFIPAITIPVSLIGTFIFVKVLGFSINTLTLFGITLATGLVVDDAIVVIENVERHITEGISEPHNAASVAMKDVAGAVIALSGGAGEASIDLLVPGLYEIAAPAGARVLVDGAAVTSLPMRLAEGAHRISWDGAAGTLRLTVAPCAVRSRLTEGRVQAGPTKPM